MSATKDSKRNCYRANGLNLTRTGMKDLACNNYKRDAGHLSQRHKEWPRKSKVPIASVRTSSRARHRGTHILGNQAIYRPCENILRRNKAMRWRYFLIILQRRNANTSILGCYDRRSRRTGPLISPAWTQIVNMSRARYFYRAIVDGEVKKMPPFCNNLTVLSCSLSIKQFDYELNKGAARINYHA